jgi:hypothetical protein
VVAVSYAMMRWLLYLLGLWLLSRLASRALHALMRPRDPSAGRRPDKTRRRRDHVPFTEKTQQEISDADYEEIP